MKLILLSIFNSIYFLSKLLYCKASKICSSLIIFELSKSAIVLATFNTLEYALALKCNFSKYDFKIYLIHYLNKFHNLYIYLVVVFLLYRL